jgi:hypothetical protein
MQRISKGEPPSLPIELCEAITRPHPIRAMLLGLMYKMATITGEWNQLQKELANDPHELLNESFIFVEKAQALDAEMEEWMKSRPAEWNVSRVDTSTAAIPTWLNTLYQVPGAPLSVLMPSSFYIAHRINYWRATRLILNHSMLNAIDLQLSIAKSTTSQTTDFTTVQGLLELRVLDLVGETCDAFYATMTLHLTEKPEAYTADEVCGIRGYTMLWPMYRAGMCFKRSGLKEMDLYGRCEWIRAALKFLADDLCIAKAQAFLDNVDGKYGEMYH